MARRKHRFFWHVPATATDPNYLWDNWSALAPGGGGNPNVGADIFLPLVQTNQGAFLSQMPERDEFVVERIIGQFMLQAISVTQNRMCMHRIYPSQADAGAVALRDLFSQDDAESDFLWNRVEPAPAYLDGDVWGNWQEPATNSANPAARSGRWHGDLDVRVGRRLRAGECLLWHTQFSTVGGGVPTDDTYFLRFNLRILVREG